MTRRLGRRSAGGGADPNHLHFLRHSIDVEEGIVEACPPEVLEKPLEFKLVNLKEVPWMASNLLIKPLAIASK